MEQIREFDIAQCVKRLLACGPGAFARAPSGTGAAGIVSQGRFRLTAGVYRNRNFRRMPSIPLEESGPFPAGDARHWIISSEYYPDNATGFARNLSRPAGRVS